ncbi:hypothetical protein NCCP2716_22550 [Sporosarcina sp. NCCP-2716]|nr:hypothetical protein [Sporosarcina sp. NCCP-2716]GKV69757.1 hypothetical protein NCCP2716_22550 [Sporosarcina sp. NCCP-2716]
MQNKKEDSNMQATDKKQTESTKRKEMIKASYEKAVKENGKALEKLSKN